MVRWDRGDLVMNFLNSLVILCDFSSDLFYFIFSRSVSLAPCDQGQRRSTDSIVIRDESLAHNATAWKSDDFSLFTRKKTLWKNIIQDWWNYPTPNHLLSLYFSRIWKYVSVYFSTFSVSSRANTAGSTLNGSRYLHCCFAKRRRRKRDVSDEWTRADKVFTFHDLHIVSFAKMGDELTKCSTAITLFFPR